MNGQDWIDEQYIKSVKDEPFYQTAERMGLNARNRTNGICNCIDGVHLELSYGCPFNAWLRATEEQ